METILTFVQSLNKAIGLINESTDLVQFDKVILKKTIQPTTDFKNLPISDWEKYFEFPEEVPFSTISDFGNISGKKNGFFYFGYAGQWEMYYAQSLSSGEVALMDEDVLIHYCALDLSSFFDIINHAIDLEVLVHTNLEKYNLKAYRDEVRNECINKAGGKKYEEFINLIIP